MNTALCRRPCVAGIIIAGAALPAMAQQIARERADDPPGKPGPLILSVPAIADGLRGPGPSVRIHQVNVTSLGLNTVGDAANEPTIAVDPTAPNRVVIGWRQFDTITSNFRQGGWGHSLDGGRTWRARTIQPGVFRTDPVMRFNADGVLFWNLLYAGGGPYRCDIFVSNNAGQSWAGGPYLAYGGDKAWMAVDRTTGPARGAIYQAWNIAANPYAPNTFNRCFNNGVTWTDLAPIPLSPVFGQVAVAPDGSVLVAGIPNSSRTSLFFVARSANAGIAQQAPAFSFVATVPMGGDAVLSVSPNPGGLPGQINLAIDHSNGLRRGWIYLLANVDPPGVDPLDVMLSRSTDNGQTWSPPIRVNTDPPGPNAWQWMATLAVAPDGRLDVVWIDTRASQTANRGTMCYRSSPDGGDTWSAERPFGVEFNSHVGWPNQNKMGDYFDMESDLLGASLAFCATYNGEQDVYFARIGPDDCNANGQPDDSEIASGAARDCNGNGIPDDCDIAAGLLARADASQDGEVTPADLAAFIVAWLRDLNDGTLVADADRNGAVDPADIALMVRSWVLALGCP
ncbi:MAG: hypothetical protein KF745_08125 [Phycisphaeraceae bacterium]|nr:hypothetical protein [Phycisphaeraceae bacterium]